MRPSLFQRAQIENTARKEMREHMSKLTVKRAFEHKTASSTDTTFVTYDMVVVWRENIVNRRIGEQMRPYVADSVEVEKTLIHVRNDGKRSITPFNFF